MQRDEILKTLRAAAMADALGVPVEMQTRDTYRLSGMVGEGTWDQPAGSWSDDTSMTLCTIQNILDQGSYDDLLIKFEHYMRFGEWTPRGETFDIGRTCSHAVRQHAINHVAAVDCGDRAENANGNGALMRLAPLVWLLQDEPQERRFQVTRDYTTITHGHPRAVVGSFVYLEICHELLGGNPLPEVLQIVEKTVSSQLAELPEYQAELAYYQELFRPKFSQTSRMEIKSSAYVVETLEAAVWLALRYSDLRLGLLAAVNLGGDTDTIATIAASLIMLGHPDQVLPEDWWSVTLDHKQLDRIMTPFAEKFAK